ncbi:MAG: ParD-like family protein [Legionellales bacterium]|nr:ParD-like family protein [Legionellales bacterium]
MSVPIRIDDEIYNEAKKVAKAEFRTIPSQIEFWARVGKCALENPDLPVDFVKKLLISKNTDRSLAEPFEFSDG